MAGDKESYDIYRDKFEASLVVAGIGALYGAVAELLPTLPVSLSAPMFSIAGLILGFFSGAIAVGLSLTVAMMRTQRPSFLLGTAISSLGLALFAISGLGLFSLVIPVIGIYVGFRVDKDILSGNPRLPGIRYAKQLLMDSGQLPPS